QHELVVAAADGIRAHEHRLQDAVGLVARRLLGARPIEAPDGRLLTVGHDLGLRTQLLRWLGPVDPDVFGSVDAQFNPSLAVLGSSLGTVAKGCKPRRPTYWSTGATPARWRPWARSARSGSQGPPSALLTDRVMPSRSMVARTAQTSPPAEPQPMRIRMRPRSTAQSSRPEIRSSAMRSSSPRAKRVFGRSTPSTTRQRLWHRRRAARPARRSAGSRNVYQAAGARGNSDRTPRRESGRSRSSGTGPADDAWVPWLGWLHSPCAPGFSFGGPH